MSFEIRAWLGYAILALLLAIGMALSARRLVTVADDEVARIRGEEREITIVERLRWNSELIVSNGRGYLLSRDPDLLRQIRDAQARFDEDVRALRRQTLSPAGFALLAEAEAAARSFRRVQDQLLIARQRSDDTRWLVREFETKLLPLRRDLGQSLARLVDHKEAALQDLYEEARSARRRLELRIYGLLGLLVLAGFMVAWYFARLLGRSYREEREALETARRAVAARDELMGIVAHDLRNPLGAITIKAGLLRKGAVSETTRAQAESIENITMRMEYLIRSMLDVTTIEAGRFSITQARCAVEDLVRQTTDLFDSLSGSKQIRFEQSLKEPGLAIHADRERVLEVLSNIVGNALKFTAPGGHVTLSVDREGAEARFAVLDTGPGIPREHLSHVFDRFWKNPTPGKKGTGLGLFIAKGIVDAHGGRIWVESDPGHGARFYFTLPLVDPRPHVVPSEEAGIRATSREPKPA